MLPNASQLIQSGQRYEHIDTKQLNVARCDDQRIARPDDAGGSQSCGLSGAQLVSRTSQITNAGNDESLVAGKSDSRSKKGPYRHRKGFCQFSKLTHLNAGAQKKTVFGPAGCSQAPRSRPGTTPSTARIKPLYRALLILKKRLIGVRLVKLNKCAKTIDSAIDCGDRIDDQDDV